MVSKPPFALRSQQELKPRRRSTGTANRWCSDCFEKSARATLDLSELERQRWPAKSLNSSLDLRLSSQLQLLNQMAAEYSQEWTFPDQPTARPRYHYNNGFFETVDAEMAYCFVRHFKPARIIEVGGGFSTRLLTEALRANLEQDGIKGELTTIDPGLDPSTGPFLDGSTEFIPRPVQEVDLKRFLSLKEGDILFLDSSHVVGVGSDVVYEYLEVIPRLRPGVLVHAHDIFVPFDYPRELVVDNLSFWSEQYLLRAFLSFNSSVETSSQVHRNGRLACRCCPTAPRSTD